MIAYRVDKSVQDKFKDDAIIVEDENYYVPPISPCEPDLLDGYFSRYNFDDYNVPYMYNDVYIGSGVLNVSGLLRDCYRFNNNVVFVDTNNSILQNCANLLRSCHNFNKPLTIPKNVMNCSEMMAGCYAFSEHIYFKGNNARNINTKDMLRSRQWIDVNQLPNYVFITLPAYVHVHPSLAGNVMNNIIYGISWTPMSDGNGWYNNSEPYNVYVYNNYEG